eukprot:TRINITY_DN18975_c0_g1_i4.p1 TRINITY_DN18975_c0_g1~~TRINITY_DN18975_c0_g1_i4.p1  ORF type:complete len:254 (+),score=62.01 TRINITY_DN18975_c0_g1_i4:202-963(+)
MAEEETIENALGRVVVGVLGHPNAGKSSLINAVMGRAAVAVSATPGKTKHLQTIILNDKIMLCDCPGLVFPAVDMPRPLQVLGGIFPLSYTREPYSSVGYLADRVPLEQIYHLPPPVVSSASSSASSSSSAAASSRLKQQAKSKAKAKSKGRSSEEDDLEFNDALNQELEKQLAATSSASTAAPDSVNQAANGPHRWSAWEICEVYAKLKGYKLGGGSLDVYRAAHDILDDALSGSIHLSFPPPPFHIDIPIN